MHHIQLAKIKPFMLPIAMAIGILCHNVIGVLAFLTPYLIFTMLFVTFCKLNPRHIRFTPQTGFCLAAQLTGAAITWFAIAPFNQEVAQGVFICFFCPTATAAPVITAMLGGSLEKVTTYSLMSNLAIAILAPPVFSLMGENSAGLLDATMRIAGNVGPLILLPLICAMAMQKFTPKISTAIASHQSISFYLWSVSLIIVVGQAVSFIMAEPPSMIPEMIAIALLAGVACAIQFIIGRRIGGRFGDMVSGGQGLGQKNTVLAIWMALTYLHPIASIGPAAYIAWQNTINSMQLYYHQRSTNKTKNLS